MKIKATLEAIHSAPDIYGNRYWAMIYTDHRTGKVVKGTISGGESNIYGVRLETPAAKKSNNWDGSVLFQVSCLKIREFNRLVKDWPYAGCLPADLWKFIKSGLRKQVVK